MKPPTASEAVRQINLTNHKRTSSLKFDRASSRAGVTDKPLSRMQSSGEKKSTNKRRSPSPINGLKGDMSAAKRTNIIRDTYLNQQSVASPMKKEKSSRTLNRN